MAGAVALFALLGGSLLAGYIGGWLFRRHRISDIAFLLGAGVLAGPVLGLVDPAPFAPAFAALAPLALAIVLFEGGLELSWNDLKRHAGRAFATSIAVWGLSVAFLGAAAALVLGLAPHLALLFALAVSATGILAVIPLLAEMRAPAGARVTLTVETSLGDLLSAVTVVALAGMLVLGATPADGARLLAAHFLIGGSVGLIGGLLTARALHHLEDARQGYAVLLAIVLLAYALAESIGGSGLLAALTLGLVAGNARDLMARGGFARLAAPASAMRLHQNHIIFLLRSVYFVFLGISFAPEAMTLQNALIALALTAAVVAARIVAIAIAPAPRGERLLMVAMMPRGLAAAILAGVPHAMGVPGTESFVTYAFLVIVGADIATTIGLAVHARRERGRPAPQDDARDAPAPH